MARCQAHVFLMQTLPEHIRGQPAAGYFVSRRAAGCLQVSHAPKQCCLCRAFRALVPCSHAGCAGQDERSDPHTPACLLRFQRARLQLLINYVHRFKVNAAFPNILSPPPFPRSCRCGDFLPTQ